MAQRAIPAVFMRGGTSKGLFFHHETLSKFLPAVQEKVRTTRIDVAI